MAEKKGRRVFRRRVRRRSQPAKFVRVHELKCFDQVKERLKAGWPISKVTDYIQRERAEYTDVTRESLMKTLGAFRETLSKTELLQTRMPDKVEQWQQEAEEALDEVKELADLYKLQMERIQIDASNEKNINKLFKTLGQEVFYAMKLLQTSAAIKMDYGLKKRDPASMPSTNVNVLGLDLAATYGNEAVQNVVQDPVSRRKVVSLVEKMAKLELERRDKLVAQGQDVDLAEMKVVNASLDKK